jgi:creatinine amidohydrolase/Fe(II)-dependent formamide hydrolase-like protein
MERDVPSRSIGDLTFQEISKNLQTTSILCMPIGSVEQHGPHLPLNTDVVLAEEYTRRMIARWGKTFDLWQLPTLTISLAREHDWAPGTLSLSIHSMTAFMRDLGREIIRSLPARNLAIINGHGGNRGILEALAQELRADFGFNMCVLHPTVWLDGDTTAELPEIHGGKNETSMMLALVPNLVRRNQIAQLKSAPSSDAMRATILDQAVTWPWTTKETQLAELGVIGDPHAASAEFGQHLLSQIEEMAGPVFRQLLDRQDLARG